ncbi:phage terminase small subunit [Clostridiales Family XIII bacterium ASD5510]|uniref:Phage terminase small subunit n=2 Tax=Bacteria TaxID=2 RepID=A0A9J6QYG8_9FIRM|nr:phage terminase small subunit [Hominibacterium faecale]MCU7380501.1 phage terminase small subunit [Hominibacterium faecale]
MPRARSPNSIEAEKLYHEGMRLVDIADKLGVPAGTVRRWKSTQNWDTKEGNGSKKKQSERSEKKKANVRKKPGPPKGSKNAAGHGAPKGNKNALKHGGYSAIYWDTLDEEEQEMIEGTPKDEEDLLIEQIMLFGVRERRLMQAINKYKGAKGGVYVDGAIRNETKRTFKDETEAQIYEERIKAKVEAKERLPGDVYNMTTSTSSTADLVARLERELTSVQSKKTKAIESLAKLRLEKQKLQRELTEDGAAEVNAYVQFYIPDNGRDSK